MQKCIEYENDKIYPFCGAHPGGHRPPCPEHPFARSAFQRVFLLPRDGFIEVRYDASTGREYTKFADGTVQLVSTKVNGKDVEVTIYRIFDKDKTYTKNSFSRRVNNGKAKYEVYMGRWSKISAHKTITRYIDCETGIPFATLSKDVLVQMTAGIEVGEQPAKYFELPEEKGYTLIEDGMSKLYDMMNKKK